MELFPMLYHLGVFIGWSIANNYNLVDILQFIQLSYFIKKYLVSLISQSSFRFNAGHEIFKILGIFRKVRLLKYPIHRFYVIVPVNHNLMLEGNGGHFHFNYSLSSCNCVVKDTENCIKGGSHRTSSVNRNNSSNDFT